MLKVINYPYLYEYPFMKSFLIILEIFKDENSYE